jgi:hypothetical protein
VGFLATNFCSQALHKGNSKGEKEIKSVIRTSCDKIVLYDLCSAVHIQSRVGSQGNAEKKTEGKTWKVQ